MAIHVLGNGPSIEIFNRDIWPESDIFVGCNFSDVNLRPNYTVMVDVKATKKFVEGLKLTIPVVLSKRNKGFMDTQTMKPPEDAFILKDVMDNIHLKELHTSYGLNSAQHAVMYSIKNETDLSVLHLWGIDSFWSNNLLSNTDSIMRPNVGDRIREDIANPWREFWKHIFIKNPDTQFYIHAPFGSNIIKPYAEKNVEFVYHS